MTKKSFSTSIKCGLYSNFVKNLTDAQRTSVRACGFSSLLHFDCTEAPRSVGYMLAQRFDVPTRTVRMENGSTFELNAFVAHQILGVPVGGWKVKDHASRSEKETVVGDTGTGTVAPTIDHLMKLVTPDLTGDKFVRVFMLISLATLLCPTSYPRASKRYYSAVASVVDIPKYDWSFFIVDWLVEGIDDFQKSVAANKQMSTLCGCIVVLVFAFFEYIKAPDIILREDWPRIKVWDDRMVHEYLELEGMSEDDSFGHFELKDVSETPFVAVGSLSSTMFARLPAQVESFIENMAPHYDDNLSGHNNQTNARRQMRDMCSKFHRDIMGASISAIQPVVSKQLCSMAEFMWNYHGGAGTCAPGATDTPGSSVHMDSHGGDATPVQVHRESARGVTTRSRSKQRTPTPISEGLRSPVCEGLRTRSTSRQKNTTFVPEVESTRSRSRKRDSPAAQMNTTPDAFMSSATRKGKKKLDGGMLSGTTNSVNRGMRSFEPTKSSSDPDVAPDSPQNVLQEKMKTKDSASIPEIDPQPNEADASQENNEILDSSQDNSVGGRNPVAQASVAQLESNAELDTGQLGGDASNLGTTPSNLDEVVPDSFEGEEPPASSHKRKIDAISSTAKEIESAFVSNINKGKENQRLSEKGLDKSKNLSQQNAKAVSGDNRNLGGREQPVVEPSVTKTGVNDGARTIVENVIGHEQRGQDSTNSGDMPSHTESTSIGSINCAQPYSYTTPNFPTITRIGLELSTFVYTSNLKSHAKGNNQSGSVPGLPSNLLDKVVPDCLEGAERPPHGHNTKRDRKKRHKGLFHHNETSPQCAEPIVTSQVARPIIDGAVSILGKPGNVALGDKSTGKDQAVDVTPQVESPSLELVPSRTGIAIDEEARGSSGMFTRKRALKIPVDLFTQSTFFFFPQQKVDLSKSDNYVYSIATRRLSKAEQDESKLVAEIGRFYVTEPVFGESFRRRGWVHSSVMDVFCEAQNADNSVGTQSTTHKCFLTSDIVQKLKQPYFDTRACSRYVSKHAGFSMDGFDMVMIPVCESLHWWLIVVDLRDHRFDVLNSVAMDDNSSDITDQICNNFRKLYQSMFDKPNIMDKDTFRVRVQPTPKQQNNFDCGIFAMKFMELWTGRKVYPLAKDMSMYRRQIVNYILRHPKNKRTTNAIEKAFDYLKS